MKHSIYKKFSFEMAHVLRSAFSEECNNTIHGHSYKLGVKLTAPLNDGGMILDFKKFGVLIKNFVVDRLDHACWLHSEALLEAMKQIFPNGKFLYWSNKEPTAEVMATYIAVELGRLFNSDFHKKVDFELEITLWETEDSCAIVQITLADLITHMVSLNDCVVY